jgi:signal transduction histidine kinase
VVIDITDRRDIQNRLEEAVRARDTFLSIAAHELRTPLTSLLIQTQSRRRQLQKGNLDAFHPDRLARMFENDERSLNRLARLVDDMLDISRIQTGKLQIQREEADLCRLVHDVVERMAQHVESTGSCIEQCACEPVWGHWDRYRVEQVCMNLITNAARYGLGKPIRIWVEADATTASIHVQDQGRGIAKADQRRIFEQFERAISANEVSGLGLGLYIVKQIVEAHGGTVEVESDVHRAAPAEVRELKRLRGPRPAGCRRRR